MLLRRADHGPCSLSTLTHHRGDVVAADGRAALQRASRRRRTRTRGRKRLRGWPPSVRPPQRTLGSGGARAAATAWQRCDAERERRRRARAPHRRLRARRAPPRSARARARARVDETRRVLVGERRWCRSRTAGTLQSCSAGWIPITVRPSTPSSLPAEVMISACERRRAPVGGPCGAPSASGHGRVKPSTTTSASSVQAGDRSGRASPRRPGLINGARAVDRLPRPPSTREVARARTAASRADGWRCSSIGRSASLARDRLPPRLAGGITATARDVSRTSQPNSSRAPQRPRRHWSAWSPLPRPAPRSRSHGTHRANATSTPARFIPLTGAVYVNEAVPVLPVLLVRRRGGRAADHRPRPAAR